MKISPNHFIGFNIAPPDDPMTPFFTVATTSHGAGNFADWNGDQGEIILHIEPYQGETQFLLEWLVEHSELSADQMLSVMQGIRNVAENLKLERGNPLTNIKVSVTDGRYTGSTSQARATRLATIHAFEEALTRANLIPYGENVQ